MNNVFAYIWEYIVKDKHIATFERTYGPEGDWVQLFKKADGYMTTDLHQDIANPNRFVTVDFWATKDDRDNFRKQFSEDFEILDARCESYTDREQFMGDFNTYTSRFTD